MASTAVAEAGSIRDLDRETAGLLPRGSALVIDAFLFSPLIVLLLWPSINVPVHEEPYPVSSWIYWLAPWRVAVGYAVAFAYGTLMLGGFGRTVGMKWLGVRVTNLHGSDIGWTRAALRTAVLLAPFLAAWILRYQELPNSIISAPAEIGLLWAMLDRAHQGYHDKLAGTLVMREQRYQARRATSL